MGTPDTVAGGSVQLRVPAASAYVAIIRSVTAGLAARCDLTLDEIEDLRIAIDEACALLLPLAIPGSALSADFDLEAGSLKVRTAVPARDGVEPNRDGFAWTVLDALATRVDIMAEDGQIAISLTKLRETAQS
ncbi:MAG: anti-sigma regulatory factor [Actinobacteria bacterium]|nr:anti-sigma regulatory factor [Actinomycetota bacterium]